MAVDGVGSGFIGISKLGTVYRAGGRVLSRNLVPAAYLADARIKLGEARIASRE